MDYTGKHVLVLGLGETGLAMALWLLRCGARLRVADTRPAPARLPQLLQAAPEVEFVAGEFTSGAAGRHRFRRGQPGPGARARTGGHRAGGRSKSNTAMERDRAVCPGSGGLARATGLRPARHRHHRHQRQDHGDAADRPAVCPRRMHGPGGRQHQPARARHAARRAGTRRAARKCGCWNCRASSSTSPTRWRRMPRPY